MTARRRGRWPWSGREDGGNLNDDRDSRLRLGMDARENDRAVLERAVAMLRYANRQGRTVDPSILSTLGDAAILAQPGKRRTHVPGNPEFPDELPSTSAPGSPDTTQAESDAAMRQRLQRAHDRLANVIRPARPETVLLLERERQRLEDRPWFTWLGPLPFIRFLVGSALCILAIVVVLVALSPDPLGQPHADTPTNESQPSSAATARMVGSADVASARPADNVNAAPAGGGGDWTENVIDAFALVGTAYLGAVFSVLYRLRTQVLRGTYRQEQEFSYAAEIVLGLIAGFVLAVVIQLEAIGDVGVTVTQPLLALIGGFSAGVVYLILTQIVRALQAVFEGDPEERIALEIQASRHRADAESTRRSQNWRVDVAATLEQLAVGASPRHRTRCGRYRPPWRRSQGSSREATLEVAAVRECWATGTAGECVSRCRGHERERGILVEGPVGLVIAYGGVGLAVAAARCMSRNGTP